MQISIMEIRTEFIISIMEILLDVEIIMEFIISVEISTELVISIMEISLKCGFLLWNKYRREISIMEISLECDSQYGNKYGIYGAPLWK